MLEQGSCDNLGSAELEGQCLMWWLLKGCDLVLRPELMLEATDAALRSLYAKQSVSVPRGLGIGSGSGGSGGDAEEEEGDGGGGGGGGGREAVQNAAAEKGSKGRLRGGGGGGAAREEEGDRRRDQPVLALLGGDGAQVNDGRGPASAHHPATPEYFAM